MDQKKKNAYVVPVIIAVFLAFVCAFVKNLFVFTTLKNLFGVLSDCFMLPGVLLAGVGALGWIASLGFFDIMSYGTRSFLGTFIKPLAEDLPHTFYEYRVQKDEKGRKWSKETVIVGLISLAISVLLLIVWFLL